MNSLAGDARIWKIQRLPLLFLMASSGRRYRFDARLHGGERAIIMQGEYDKVLPMDIRPSS